MSALLAPAIAFARAHHKIILAVLAVLLVLMILAGIFGAGRDRERAAQEAAAAAAALRAEQRNSAALEAAAAQRRTDEAQSAATEKELQDAVRSLPDAVPSARRVALGCARLRRAGQDTSRLPQCA